jgi:hypothetical protein
MSLLNVTFSTVAQQALHKDLGGFLRIFRGILRRAEIEFAEEKEDSGSEVVEGAKAQYVS